MTQLSAATQLRKGEDALFVRSPAQQLFYEDVEIGQEVPGIVRGPLDISHMARWASAIQDWHKIHYDWKFAVEHDKLPDVVGNGSWMQQIINKTLREWLGEGGWLWKFGFRIRAMHFPGDTLTFWATVRDKYEFDGLGVLELVIGVRKQDGQELTAAGEAIGILPLRDGRPVPYPFPYPFAPTRP
jgi:acyl dehydratase